MVVANEKVIRRGSYVKWVAGGPVMLVRLLSQAPEKMMVVSCAWFSPDQHYHLAEIPIDELEVVDAPKSAV